MSVTSRSGFSIDEHQRIDLVSVGLIISDFTPINRLFDEVGLPRPHVSWLDPDEPQTIAPQHIKVYQYWRNRRDGTKLPPLDRFDPLDDIGSLGNVHVMASNPEKYDFSFRVSASTDCSRVGNENTPSSISSASTPVQIRVFLGAIYRAAAYRKTPLIAVHASKLNDRITECDRLLLPISSENDSVDHLLVGLTCRDWVVANS